jgi:predicted negative regulator of RcsB-dependent stress response
MKETIRKSFAAVIKAFEVEMWIENILFLLLVLFLLGFAAYLGWQHFNQ